MISPARSTTVSWASIKAVSLVAMAPGKPESSRSGTGTAAAWTARPREAKISRVRRASSPLRLKGAS